MWRREGSDVSHRKRRDLPSLPTLIGIAKELGVHAADILAFDMRDPRARLLDAARRRDRDDVRVALRALKLAVSDSAEPNRLLRVADSAESHRKRLKPQR